VVGIKTETKCNSPEALSNISKFSPVKNQTDRVFSVGNFTNTTFLKEFVFCNVLAA
jgi:hypothetical protein